MFRHALQVDASVHGAVLRDTQLPTAERRVMMLRRQATGSAEGDLGAERRGDGHPPDDVCEGGVGRGVAGEGGDADPVEEPRVDGGGGRA